MGPEAEAEQVDVANAKLQDKVKEHMEDEAEAEDRLVRLAAEPKINIYEIFVRSAAKKNTYRR